MPKPKGRARERGEWTRREFLRAGALVGAGLAACRTQFGGAARVGGATRFEHGVASGDPLADRVILWTRVTPDDVDQSRSVEVAWRVASDAAMRDVVAQGTATTDASRDFTVKVDAAGLAPGCIYFYEFESGNEASPVGRTRTLPRGRVERLRIASTSCSNYPHGYFNAYAAIARRDDLDVVLHLGDYIYEYGNDGYGAGTLGRDAQPPHELLSLADYRTRYAQYRRDPDLQALHRQHPMIAVWDDHECSNDAWRGGAQNHDPATEGDWATRRAAAVRAWREWMPARVEDTTRFDADPRIWRAFRFGDLVDLMMLDTRLAARDMQAPRTDRALIEAPGRTLLGAEQEAWLFAQLDDSKAAGTRWRLVGQQVVFAPFTRLPRPPNTDAWDGYPEARRRVLDHLASRDLRDVVILSGDVHSSWGFEVPLDPFSPHTYDAASSRGSRAVEFVAPAISSSPLGSFPGARERYGDAAQTLPHLRFMDLDQHGYVLLDIDPERTRAEWWFVDGVERRESGERLARALHVQRGTSRLEVA